MEVSEIYTKHLSTLRGLLSLSCTVKSLTSNNATRRCQLSVNTEFMSYRGTAVVNYLLRT